jgi:hypothetical protein
MERRYFTCLGCGLLLLVLAALGGFGFYISFIRPASPDQVAARFLSHIADGRGDAAYADAARDLRSRKTPDMLRLEFRTLGINSYGTSAWSEPHIAGREATLEGTVTTRAGQVIPLVITLVREEEQWRVLSVAAAPEEPEGEEGSGDAATGK